MPFFLLSPLLEAGSHVAKAFLYNLLCSQGWSLTYYVAKDNLELLMVLSPVLKAGVIYRRVVSHPVYSELQMEETRSLMHTP